MSIPEDEIAFYNAVAYKEAQSLSELNSITDIEKLNLPEPYFDIRDIVETDSRTGFPEPEDLWIRAKFECLAEWDSYSYLSPMQGKRVLQIGGKGFSAVHFALAGASEAWLLAPLDGEIKCAEQTARLAGVTLGCKLGEAEDIPFPDSYFDGVYAGGCAHHFQTERAFPEIARVLKDGGRFAAVEPWKAPLHVIGTKIFGKREPVNCKPLTWSRVAPLAKAFSDHKVVHHGTFVRYPMIVLEKFGIKLPLNAVRNIMRADDAFCSVLPGLRNLGSSVAVLACK